MADTTESTYIATARRGKPDSPGRYVWVAATCAALMIVFYLSSLYGREIPVAYFLPMHLVLELLSIVVSFAVFAVGWYGYRQSGNARDLLIGLTFGATAAIDLVHTLSYKGMPDFLGVNTPGKAAAYWLVARLMVGVGLLAASFVNPESRSRWLRPAPSALATAAVVSAVVVAFTVYGGPIGAAMYTRVGEPPTVIKTSLEYLAIALYLAAFAVVSSKRGWEPAVIVNLRSALIVAAFAELAFTLYLSPFGWTNAFGHVLKALAYFLILRALFASAIKRPYEELAYAKDELQALYLDAREHRKEIERSFARVGTALSSSLRIGEALDLIAELAANMEHVDCSIVLALDKTGSAAQVAAQKGGCHKAERPVDVALLAGRQTLVDGRSVIVDDLEATGWIDCDFSESNCLRSMACAPMILDDRALGVVAVFSHSKRAFENGDARLLEGFASHAAVAVHNALSYERESRIADVLQKAFMGSGTLKTDRFEIAQVYQPAMDESLVGGDFHDVFELPDGRIGLVIGDVSGKGLAAAVHTAMIRYALRAYAVEGHSPASSLGLLNRLVGEQTHHDTFVTMFFGLLDGTTGEMVYASAGHEPPVYMCDGTGLTLPSTGPALGAGIEMEYEQGSIVLKPGSVLLLYTDGISEARRGKEFLGTEGIGKLLGTCHEMNSEDIAECVYRAAVDFAGGALRDDAAIMAVRGLR
jgi:hypothetical protein